MVGRKKKTKICDKVSEEEDRITQLPESLISEILCHLSTKEAVRTSVLSTKWRNFWRWIPDLDLRSSSFSNSEAFVSFVERFFDSHRESWIRKLRLNMDYTCRGNYLIRWTDAATKLRIQHLDVERCFTQNIPKSIYTCETLVHLRLSCGDLCNAEFVSLPCLKIMHLDGIIFPNETTFQKLISGSPVLEDLTIIRSGYDTYQNVLQVRSQTLRRINIVLFDKVVIDAPLLQCLRTNMYSSNSTKNFEIINLGFSTKLDITADLRHATDTSSLIHDILTDISRVRDLVISNGIWKEIFLYSKSGSVLQFGNLSQLNAGFSESDLELLPTILESCPKLESFILELVKDRSMTCEKKKEPKVVFSTVPQCLVSSIKFVELKRSISGYEGEMELVRYFLKNSRILEKLRLKVYYPKNAKCAFLEELVAIPRCSSVCEVLVL